MQIKKDIEQKKYPDLKSLLAGLMKDAELNDEQIEKYTTGENYNKFLTAFTHETFDAKNNYEFYEILGDVAVNHAIVLFYNKIFPQIKKPGGVDFMANLKMMGISKDKLSKLADSLGMFDHIRFVNDPTKYSKKLQRKLGGKQKKDLRATLLEDVFEAFCGCLGDVIEEDNKLDGKRVDGIAFPIICNFVHKQAIKFDYSLKAKDLKPAKTQLNELIHKIWPNKEERKGVLEYVTEELKNPEGKVEFFKVNVVIKLPGKEPGTFGIGKARKKGQAETIAAEYAIRNLEKFGYKIDYKEVEDL